MTPWSPRARDRALHAAVVAIARHALSRRPGLEELASAPGVGEPPTLSAGAISALQDEVDLLAERAARAAGRASHPQLVEREVKNEGTNFIRRWARSQVTHYWWDQRPDTSLLISAEQAVQSPGGGGIATRNSMREVEPSVVFRMIPALSVGRGDQKAKEG